MRKRALIEKEVASGCSSNDSDTDVAIIFDENTSSNSVDEINCNKAAYQLIVAQKTLKLKLISQLVLRILTPILVMIIIIYNPLMLIQRKRNNSLLQ